MNESRNKLVVKKYLEEVVNTGAVDSISQYISEEYTEIFEGKRYALGIDGAKAHILGVRETYPDLTVTVERQIAEGDYVATCITAHGTHQGVWLGIRPTGKKVTYTGVNIDKVVADRIVEHGGAANLLGPLLEIGAIRTADADQAT